MIREIGYDRITMVEDDNRENYLARKEYNGTYQRMSLYLVRFARKVYDNWKEGKVYVLAPTEEDARSQAECRFERYELEATYWGGVSHVPFMIRGWSDKEF